MKLPRIFFAAAVVLLARLSHAIQSPPNTNPDQWLAQAKDAMQKEDWPAAAEDLSEAIHYARTPDPAVWVMLGDSYSHLTTADFAENNRKAVLAYAKALEIDPKYLPARKLLMEHQLEGVQLLGGRKAETYDVLTKQANFVLAQDPSDRRALYISQFAQIDRRLNKIAVDPTTFDIAVKSCEALHAVDPANADAAFLLGRVRTADILDRARQHDTTAARQLLLAMDADIQRSIASQKENATMLFRMAQLELVLADTYASTAGASEAHAAVVKNRSEFLHRAFEHLDLASRLAKPFDPLYVEILSFYAQQLERPIGLMDGDTSRPQLEQILKDANAKAESIYRGMLSEDPGEGLVRLKLAEFIGKTPARVAEAIDILNQQPAQFSKRWLGAKGSYAELCKLASAIDICKFRLDLLEAAGNRSMRDALFKQAQADYAALVAKVGEDHWHVKEIEGRLQMAAGHPDAAAAALDLAASRFTGDFDQKTELNFLRARVFLQMRKLDAASPLLRAVVAADPGNFLARAQLAEVLEDQGNIAGTPPRFDDGAVAQVDALEKYFSLANPIVLRLRIRTLDRQKDADRFNKLWAMIPEKTIAERYDKSRFAASMKYEDEAIRLLESIRAEQPDQLNVVQVLAQVYLDANHPEKVLAILDDAIAKKPQNKSLQAVRQTIADPNATLLARKAAIDKITNE